ncbi:MAG: PIG-L family deacetylase [Candidatus Izemoplasmatales bacterium]|nr:PIG-L family deacetylase [Candidatus Izemoplasmatales bacterium]MDD4070187.1 PIG-L family deacetylase [Candidatus Izemoplasmatales bacterium]MDY0140249.1 PIG-L family deacetylase [Candidatus Izemoplasmatales bacterium]
MKFKNKTAGIFIPDNKSESEAFERTTHMSIAAHPDDIEIMAYDGIVKCFNQKDKWFFGVVVTDGAGSARTGVYKDYSNEEMIKIRRKEQEKAAILGDYSAVAMLDYPSKETKDKDNETIVKEIKNLILEANPEVIYTHNLADKHDTHIGVVVKTIKAIRMIEPNKRPKKLYGCEVWRNLDWLMENDKILFDTSAHPNLASALVEIFDSQIVGGKRYDLGAIGRRKANATYTESHSIDEAEQMIYGMDLTPLIENDDLDILEFATDFVKRLQNDVFNRVQKMI